MSVQIKHNVRRTRGINKGQFAKKKVVKARENNLRAILASRKRKMDQEKDFKQSQPSSEKTRRIVELNTFGDQLWCDVCHLPLSINNRIKEDVQGLATIFIIKCMMCKKLYNVRTDELSDSRTFPVNSKLALGLIDGGLGESQINTVFSSLNIPTISTSLLKRHERTIGPALEAVAKQSCIESIELEKEVTLNTATNKELKEVNVTEINERDKNNIGPSGKKVNLIASFDAGWQKRGTGHAYNSLSGHGTVIGYRTGKILSYSVKSKDCRFCKYGHPTTDHDCRLNFEGSAKAMEPQMAIDLLTKNKLFKKKNVQVNVLIGDDDSSTIASVRREASDEIEKWSDFNHTVKSLNSALYSMKLPHKLIQYFSKCFTYAVKQNKGDATKVRNAIKCIVPHAFGNHVDCGEWCEASVSENQYCHKNLPGGKALTDTELRLSLTKLFSRYANNAEKICQCGSTQSNESVNNIIASKCPKAKHYAASESLAYRVSAAVCQKNIGTSYVSKVFEKLAYSPGKTTVEYRRKKDISRQEKKVSHQSIQFKRRRLQLKKERLLKRAAINRKEGLTYESGICLNDISELIPHSNTEHQESFEDLRNFKIVVCDIETTGLLKSDELCQIAAHTIESTFNVYMIPTKSITPRASEITGLKVIDGELYLNDEKVNALPARTALEKFLNYLSSFQRPIILVAHNGFKFDVPRIMKIFRHFELMEDFKKVVKGFADTLPIFRAVLSERRKSKLKFSIQSLAVDLLPDENLDSLHNAVDDVKILKKLMDIANITDALILENVKTLAQLSAEEKQTEKETFNMITFQEYKENISHNIMKKMAKIGIHKTILEEAFKKGGGNGIRLLLSENVNGKPRVTKNKNVIKKICQLFIE